MLYILILIGIILIFIITFVSISILRLRELEDNMNICSANIENTLSEKFDNLSGLIEIIKEERFHKQLELFNEKDLFEKEKFLFNLRWDVNKYLNEQKIKETEEIVSFTKKLNLLEESIEGLKDYYNTQVMIYNEKMIHPIFSFIYQLFHFQKKEIFQLRKLEEYEILKN